MIPREVRGRGLVLFWKSIINLKIDGSQRYYIDAFIDKDTENEWHFTSFYGELETNIRWEAWNKLRHLNSHPGVPCLCIGDFNEITKHDEKLGGAIQSHNQM